MTMSTTVVSLAQMFNVQSHIGIYPRIKDPIMRKPHIHKQNQNEFNSQSRIHLLTDVKTFICNLHLFKRTQNPVIPIRIRLLQRLQRQIDQALPLERRSLLRLHSNMEWLSLQSWLYVVWKSRQVLRWDCLDAVRWKKRRSIHHSRPNKLGWGTYWETRMRRIIPTLSLFLAISCFDVYSRDVRVEGVLL